MSDIITISDSTGTCEPVEVEFMGDGIVYLSQREDDGRVSGLAISEEVISRLAQVLSPLELRAPA